jgi:prepilin-type N-terminal cleavage/methylation domain-containing protein
MNPARSDKRQPGFTLIELLVALGIFLLITGAAFTLLSSSQQRYQTESQVLTSFQEARLGLDQIVRDVNDAGYPPPSFNAGDPTLFAISPFAWSQGSGYPVNPCLIGTAGGGNCTTATLGDTAPGDFDLIVETNPNPQDPSCAPNCLVQWIRYQLQGTTLMRGAALKNNGDPDTAFNGANIAPFVQNVVNNSPNLQVGVDAGGNPITLFQQYPAMFPGGAPVPIFQYTCDTPSLSQSLPPPTAPCPLAAAADKTPANIRDVTITLIVKAPLPDATTGRARLVQLEGRGRRVNP